MRKLLIALYACAAMFPVVAANADQAPTYEQMMREPTKLKGTSACWRGTVLQIVENAPSNFHPYTWVLVLPTPRALDIVSVYVPTKMPEPRIMEGDTVEYCGVFTRLRSYQSAENSEITSPVIASDDVRRIEN